VLALTVGVVERDGPSHGLAVARAVGHRDHGPVEANHDRGDGAAQCRHLVLPLLFLGRGDAANPLGNVLNIRGRYLPSMVLLQVRLHRAHVQLRVLMADLTGKKRRRSAHNPCPVLKRAVDAPAAGALVDVALDLNRPVGGLVLLRIALACCQLYLTQPYRAPVSVKPRQRFVRRAATYLVGGLLDRPFHLQ
jgi:hypothetical protein